MIPRRTRLRRTCKPLRRSKLKSRPAHPHKRDVERADRLWSQIIRRRSATCLAPKVNPWMREAIYIPCGRETEEAGHGIERGRVGTRYDLRNGWPICHIHNSLYQTGVMKRLWLSWCDSQWGPSLAAEMHSLSRLPPKSIDLAAVTAKLEQVWRCGAETEG